ncbi:hypothetical protein SAMN05216276_10851, partial [Streptosporangium subroseum]
MLHLRNVAVSTAAVAAFGLAVLGTPATSSAATPDPAPAVSSDAMMDPAPAVSNAAMMDPAPSEAKEDSAPAV